MAAVSGALHIYKLARLWGHKMATTGHHNELQNCWNPEGVMAGFVHPYTRCMVRHNFSLVTHQHIIQTFTWTSPHQCLAVGDLCLWLLSCRTFDFYLKMTWYGYPLHSLIRLCFGWKDFSQGWNNTPTNRNTMIHFKSFPGCEFSLEIQIQFSFKMNEY